MCIWLLILIECYKSRTRILNWFADRLSRKHDYKVIVMGHSHSAEMDKDGFDFFNNESVYANVGHWTSSKPSYVKIIKVKGKEYKVSLYKKNKDGFKPKSYKKRDDPLIIVYKEKLCRKISLCF